MPLVSIGLPTYNGVQFIEECLLCLQRQTFDDFEVFISDNASTDGTSDICARFAREDQRFVHSRLEETISAKDNFLRARDLTSAPYFMWRADDDLSEAGFLSGLVDTLERSPNTVLAVGPVRRFRYIGKASEAFFDLPAAPHGDRIDRIEAVLGGCHPSWIYGLWRREGLINSWERAAKSYDHTWAFDHLTLLSPILDGQVALVPGACFVQRIFRDATYTPNSRQLLRIRRDYAAIANEMVDERDFSRDERRRLRPIISSHLERRVARWRRTMKRALKDGVRDALKGIWGRKALRG